MATEKIITLPNLQTYHARIKAMLDVLDGNCTTLQNNINTVANNYVSADEAIRRTIEGLQGQLTAVEASIRTISAGGYLQGAENLYAYGVEFDESNASPTLTRIGNTALHVTLPVQSKMRGGLLTDDGVFTPFTSTNDWTSETRDGSLGQVMVEVPAHYMKFETSGTTHRVWLSEVPMEGYKYIPAYYVSAYEATVQRSALKLASVVNTTADFRGGHNESSWDADADKTLLGRPATNISLTTFREYARNRHVVNGQQDTRWNQYTYAIHRDLMWLFVTEYATFHNQLAFNAAKTQDGYAQGGLGAGVTTVTETTWNNLSGHSPFVPCGYTDSLGNNSGVISLAHAVLGTVSVNRYRGVEMPFGHIWKWGDGSLVNVTAGNDGTSQVFTCENAAYFSSTSTANYKNIGNESRETGYVKSILFGDDGDIFPKEVGGTSVGSTTYLTDYHWTDTSTTQLRAVLLGGSAHFGTFAGFGIVNTHLVPGHVLRRVGSRLCFIP